MSAGRDAYAGVSCTRMGYYTAGGAGSIWPARRAGFALEECHADLPVPLREVR